jgi:hypothetical protein
MGHEEFVFGSCVWWWELTRGVEVTSQAVTYSLA